MWGAPPPTPPESRPLPRPPEGPACSDLLFYFFSCTGEKIPREFSHRCKVNWPCTGEKIPWEFFHRCKVKLIYWDLLPSENPNIQFPLAPVKKFPGNFPTGAGSNDPAPNGFVLLHLQKMINKYINSKKNRFWDGWTKITKNDQKNVLFLQFF